MIGYIAGLFLLWRLLLFAASLLSEKFISFTPRFPYSDIFLIPSMLPRWIWGFGNFDGVHYLTIAGGGYQAQFTQVYFPLFPLLLKYFYRILPLGNPLVNGLLLSNLLFLISLYLFYLLLRTIVSEKQTRWILAFLVFFPTSFFFGSLYTESLFLFLMLSSLYSGQKKRWWLAALTAAFASATRIIGIFLWPALLWQWNKDRIKNKKKNHNSLFSILYSSLKSPVFFTPPLGLIAYMAYLKVYFGDPLYFWHAQPVFGAARSGSSVIFMPQVIYRYIKMFAGIPFFQEAFWIAFLEFFLAISTLFLLVIAHRRKLPFTWLIFAWPAVLLPTLTGTFSSMPRYILMALPIYAVLASIGNLKIRSLLLFICLLLQLALTMLFTSGHWVA